MRVNFFKSSLSVVAGELRSAKILYGLLCLLVAASNVWSMSRWSEARGVYDDVCYLRQAHLFQRFGLDGLITDIARDDDHYLESKLKAIGFPTWSNPATDPCHILMPATQKRVIQYPPGTGFILAAFPEGFQVIPLYVLATFVIAGFALTGIYRARSNVALGLTTAFGCLAIYLMINPTKASYSVAPTMPVCALAGFLTAKMFFTGQRLHQLALTALVGLLIGLTVNFRLPNLFLSAGYLLFFLVALLMSRKIEIFVQGFVFGLSFLIGIVPTLVYNSINAGSPFSTTYGADDVKPPTFSLDILWNYVGDMQFVLLVLASAWTVWMLRRHGDGARQVGWVVAGNLVVNLAFFLSHPVFTPYYTIPVSMLSLWSLLFASLMAPVASADGPRPGQMLFRAP